ncbi:hypothetical protein N7530_011717 [Penicillium desertorum]|uniref:Uncharacterized protein n=1 Tax=Penicillium desertorum TaxID=1303715 RepID=A0A9W9WEE2_9EURO|nr:hypothetical protein N7530_011717 [Penicillium desertorum]
MHSIWRAPTMSISVDLVVTLTEAVNLQREALRSMVSTKGRWLAVEDESSVRNRCGLPSHNLVTNVVFGSAGKCW